MELNAVVTQRFEVAPGLMVMRVAPEDRDLNSFKAGQFAVLGLPPGAQRCDLSDPEDKPAKDKMIRRAYSIASASVERQYLEFYITLVRSGGLTPRLFALESGDRLWLGPKFTGTFTLDSAPVEKDVVLVATGTGLAPYMSMLRTVLHEEHDRRFVVALGSRHSWDLGYHAELVTMSRLSPHFSYLPVISRPCAEPVSWQGATGYVTNLFDDTTIEETLQHPVEPENTSVFLCGNPAMVDDMCEKLGNRGFKEHNRKVPGEIFVERYW